MQGSRFANIDIDSPNTNIERINRVLRRNGNFSDSKHSIGWSSSSPCERNQDGQEDQQIEIARKTRVLN